MKTIDIPFVKEFSKGKIHDGSLAVSETTAVQDIERFRDQAGVVFWQVGQTYTGKLVIRTGALKPDGITFDWVSWTRPPNLTA